jgi:hypothetical protein
MRRAAIVSAVLAFALSGCGGGSSDDGGGGGDAEGGETTSEAGGGEGPLSVAQAEVEGGTGLQIRGFVFLREPDEWLLCNELDTGSYPPVCIDPALKVTNPAALADVKLSKGIGQAGGLQWAPVPVSLTGDVEGDAVTVSEIAKP